MKAIKQISITAKDLARAKKFYQETLGLQHLFPAGVMEFFQCGTVRILLGGPGSGHDHISMIYFDVDDIKAKHAELKSKGVEFKGEPFMVAKLPHAEVWLAEFRDSEGNQMGLMGEVPLK